MSVNITVQIRRCRATQCGRDLPNQSPQAALLSPSAHPPHCGKEKTRCSTWGTKLLLTPAQSGGCVASLL